MHLPFEARTGRRRRDMAELEPWWLQSLVDEVKAEHPELGKHFLFVRNQLQDSLRWDILKYST